MQQYISASSDIRFRRRAIERDAATFRYALESPIELRQLLRAMEERIAAFGLFFDENPVRKPVRPLLDGEDPEVAISLVQEIPDMETVG